MSEIRYAKDWKIAKQNYNSIEPSSIRSRREFVSNEEEEGGLEMLCDDRQRSRQVD
jgi:hypothetical protein